MSDEDDETNSMENDPLPAFGNLHVANDNDRNANGGRKAADACGGGAVGRLHSPNASAEIEGEESELMVTIDAPVLPKRDLIALLKQTTAVPSDPGKITLRGFFVAVEREERTAGSDGAAGDMSDHIRELLQEYQSKDDSKCATRRPIHTR